MDLLNALRGTTRRRAAPRRRFPSQAVRPRLPVLEALEDRMLLSYSFTLLADDGPLSFFGEFPAGTTPTLNNPGTAGFRAMPKSGGEGYFTRDMQGNLGIIAITSDLISGFPTGAIINDAGTVAFPADLRAGGQAIFTGDGGPLSLIADTGPDSPFSGFLAPVASINNEDTVAFRATLKASEQTGIFTRSSDGTLKKLYGTGDKYTAFLSSNIQTNGNKVAFRATINTGDDGVFLGDGGTPTTIAMTGGTYSALAGGYANDSGTVGIVATLSVGGQAIVTGNGGELMPLVDTNGPFSSFFGIAAINNGGQVVFAANLVAGGSGLFSVQDGVVNKVIGTGDSLGDSTVVSFAAQPFPSRGLNNPGQLGFRANLADGRTVLVRADPDGETGAGSGQSDKFEVFINLSGPDVSPSLVTTTQELKGPGPAATAKPEDASSQPVFLGSLQGIQSQTTQLDYALKIARGHSDLLDHVFADVADSLFDHAL